MFAVQRMGGRVNAFMERKHLKKNRLSHKLTIKEVVSVLYDDICFYIFLNFDGSHDHVICTKPFEVSNIILLTYENNNNKKNP